MDMGRLGPALAAGGYATAWENDAAGGADHDDGQKAAEMKLLAHRLKRVSRG